MVRGARVSVGMDRAGGNKQTVSGIQRNPCFSFFLPNARS
jgi:hypothetical protein